MAGTDATDGILDLTETWTQGPAGLHKLLRVMDDRGTS